MQPIESFKDLDPKVQERAEKLDRREPLPHNAPHPSGLNRAQRCAKVQ